MMRFVRNDDGSVTLNIPKEAAIREYPNTAVFCMPRNQGFDGFRFVVDAKNFDKNADGTYSATVGTGPDNLTTIRCRGIQKRLTPDEIIKTFSEAKEEDFSPKMIDFDLPSHVVQENGLNLARAKFPDTGKYAGQHFAIPSCFKNFEKTTDDRVVYTVPDYMNFSVKGEDGFDELISAEDVARNINEGTYNKIGSSTRLTLPGKAVIQRYATHTLFRMPQTCEYPNYIYAIPNGMCKKTGEGEMSVEIRDNEGEMYVEIRGNRIMQLMSDLNGETTDLTVFMWKKMVAGKGAEAYSDRMPEGILPKKSGKGSGVTLKKEEQTK